MFNGYNETPLISYDFNQDRGEKKQENVAKWSYGHEVAGVQPAQVQANARHGEFWPGKANFLGVPNVVKCNCTGCYPGAEKQSYQVDTTRHRPWLPRTFQVPANCSSEPCKLPGYQWENQGSCYPETNIPYGQDKYSYYKLHQNSNQPGVITSVKNAEHEKKPKNEMQEVPAVQNGARHPAFCNPGYGLAKRPSYCDPMEKYSNPAPYAVDQHVGRLPVVEPFAKPVPSNLSQSRVPSTGYRSVKENVPQSYVDLSYGAQRKLCAETPINGDKYPDTFPTGNVDYFNRDLTEDPKLYFENTRHPDYYLRTNFQDAAKRNGQTLDNRKDCAISQMNEMAITGQNYGASRGKYGNSCEAFYPKELEKTRTENQGSGSSSCFQGNCESQSRPPSGLLFDAERTQNSYSYQSNPVGYRNHLGSYPYQGYNSQPRFEYSTGRNDPGQYRAASLQQNCEMLTPQQGFVSKTQQFFSAKTPTPVQQTLENKSYLESIRSEELNKNGTSKISPLRLLRKKKFINVPQETPASSTILETAPGLDVRKFWSTWAEEEEENVAPTQMVVLDCQNIDPEQAKLLHLIDPIQDSNSVCLETNASVIKNTESVTNSHDQGVSLEEKTTETESKTKIDEVLPAKTTGSCSAAETNLSEIDRGCQKTKENRGQKKSETMDKWTEKKFDFLKRAEESKAAEILRHEEEKKKIFETRLTLQQSMKKSEKTQNSERGDEGVPARFSSPDENSRCVSPEEAKTDGPHLPTSEYRRNKFLEYSVNGEEKLESGKPEEVKKEEKSLGKLLEKLPADELLCSKLKEEGGFEMEDILKKMSEINFQCAEVKLENGLDENCSRKGKKKLKRKKTDHQLENEERTDKLTVETVNKPTIKFSIQKSHDLKISFKVLNSSKGKDSDENAGVEDAEDGRKPTEDLKNSTELITLKYKTIQRDGDRRLTSDSKKSRRRKKVKMKKNRYATQEERDPLADDDFDDDHKKRSTPDGFQVQETMDSAKIKLTFKRHKGNFETEYKINSSPPEEIHSTREDEEDDDDDDDDVVAKNRSKKKSRRKRMRGIFAEPGVENIEAYSEGTCDLETILDSQKSGSIFEEDSRGSYPEEENYHLELEPSTFPELADNVQEREELDVDGNVECGQQPAELISSPVIDENEDTGTGKHDEVPLPSDIATTTDLAEERTNSEGNEIEEITFDFVTNSKAKENESVWTDDKNDASLKGEDSESQQSSYKMKSERGDEEEEVLNNNKMVGEDPAKFAALPDLELENCSDNAVPCEELNEIETIENCTTVEDEKNNEILNFETDSVEIVSTCQNICSLTESSQSSQSVLNDFKEINVLQTITIGSFEENNTSETQNESGKTSSVVGISSEKPLKSPVKNDFGTESRGSLDPNNFEHSSSSKNYETDSVSMASTKNSFDIAPEEPQSELSPKSFTGNSSSNAEGIGFSGEEPVEEDAKDEEKLEIKENEPASLSGNDSGCAECSFSADDMQENSTLNVRETEADLPLHFDAELEDGEIVDSCDEQLEKTPERTNTPCPSETFPKFKKSVEFLPRHIERRHSVNSEKSNPKESQTWLKKNFSKAKSCPPKLKFTRGMFKEEIPVDIPVENIPLPVGPPPLGNCLHLVKYKTFVQTEDKSTVSSPPEQPKETLPSCETQYVENCCRDNPPICDEEKIFRRSSKIKFSFLKRSKFSKIGLTTTPHVREENEKKFEKKTDYPKFDTEKTTFETGDPVKNSISEECQMEMVPKEGVAHDPEKVKPGSEAAELLCEDLEESVEVIDTMSDLIREEYYECEDIPTSEDLTNLEDLEMEKVNDDKFRNIMQNCLDNAKKFLNVGSLKLFSCSVDDLLELDCQASESSHGDNEKPTNISRDVLLTSCEDANEELALSGNAPPADIPMDFVPSFCSDVCPEILPVDNWPYLEEEVPSSPSKPKPDETDLIPSLENRASITIALDNAIVGLRRDANFNRFRRKRLLSDSEALSTCSKLCTQRRKTIESFTGVHNGRDNIENDVTGLKMSETENNSLRCRLSLDKISSNRGSPFINDESPKGFEFGERTEMPKCLDFKSPSWQPKVMLFRISKKELRKVLKSSRIQRRFSSGSGNSPKRKVSNESENKPVSTVKRQKSDSDLEKYVKPQQEAKDASDELEKKIAKEEKSFDLSKLDSIKGSLTEADPETRKRKKSRFRNLHTKRKVDPENNEASKRTEPRLVDAETAFEEMFKNCDGVSNPPNSVGITTKHGNEKAEKMKNKATYPHDGKLRKKWGKRHRERGEKSEGRDRRGHRDRPREDEGSNHDKHLHNRDRSKRSRSESERKSSNAEERRKHQRRQSSENWMCEVCGFGDAKERVSHIKSHPFHCQSCHLAFKTEARFTSHLIKMHKDIQNQHHCLLCELSFDTEAQYQGHLESREHTHLESVEKNTINTLFTLLTGAPCPVFGVFEMKPEWLPNQAGTVHFYHQATPLSLALQYLKMHQDLTSFSTPSSIHPN